MIHVRWLLLVVFVLCACQKNDQSSVQPEKLAEGSASASAAAAQGSGPGPLVPYASAQASGDPAAPVAQSGEVTLLDPGKEPRRELRLKPKVGQADVMKMTMTMDMNIKVGTQTPPTQKLPPMIMNMAMKVTDIKPNGDISYEFKLTGTDVKAGPGANAEVVKAIKDALGKLTGMNGSAVVTDRGFNKEAKINLPPGADAQTKQVMQGMEQAMQQIGAPLPKEPVGVGAKWQYVTNLTQSGITLKQNAFYDLIKMDGDNITCKVKVDQSAPKQKVAAPGGVSVDLLSMKSDGGGQTELQLTKLTPVKSTMNLLSAVQMAMPQNQMMDMKTNMVIDITSL